MTPRILVVSDQSGFAERELRRGKRNAEIAISHVQDPSDIDPRAFDIVIVDARCNLNEAQLKALSRGQAEKVYIVEPEGQQQPYATVHLSDLSNRLRRRFQHTRIVPVFQKVSAANKAVATAHEYALHGDYPNAIATLNILTQHANQYHGSEDSVVVGIAQILRRARMNSAEHEGTRETYEQVRSDAKRAISNIIRNRKGRIANFLQFGSSSLEDLLVDTVRMSPDDPHVRFELALAYAMDENPKAYNTLVEALTLYDNMLGPRGVHVLQKEGTTTVQKPLQPLEAEVDVVLKRFTKGSMQPLVENDILNALRTISITLDNSNERIRTPVSYLIQHAEDPQKHPIFLATELLHGVPAATLMLSGERSQVYTLAQLCVDTTTAVSRAIARACSLDCETVRKDRTWFTRYLTGRFLARAGKDYGEESESEVIALGKTIDALAKDMPSYLIAGHTSGSPRDIMVEIKQDENEKEAVRIGRCDLPRKEARTSLLGIIGLLESSYCARLTTTDRSRLFYRGVANMLAAAYPELAQSGASVASISNAGSKKCDPRRAEEAITHILQNSIRLLPAPDNRYGIADMEKIIPYLSLAKHLTTISHKASKIAAAKHDLGELTQREGVREHVVELAARSAPKRHALERTLRDELRSKPTLTERQNGLLEYLEKKDTLAVVERSHRYHCGAALERIHQLGLYRLRGELQNDFGLWTGMWGRQCDLKVHTLEGSGEGLPLAQALDVAQKEGLGAIAIADNDTMSMVEQAEAASRRTGMRVIPAAELTARDDEDWCHIIAYFPNERPSQQVITARFGKPRLARMQTIIDTMYDKELIGKGFHNRLIETVKTADGTISPVTLATQVAREYASFGGRLAVHLRRIHNTNRQVEWMLHNVLSRDAPNPTSAYCTPSKCVNSEFMTVEQTFDFLREYGAVFGYSRILVDTNEFTASRLLKEGWQNGALLLGVGHPKHSPDNRRWLREELKRAKPCYEHHSRITPFRSRDVLALDYSNDPRIENAQQRRTRMDLSVANTIYALGKRIDR